MGNSDKVVIFNKSFGILVRGRDYSKEPEVVQIALKQFDAEAKASIDMFYEAKKRDPESVIADYRPEDESQISSIEIYDVHN